LARGFPGGSGFGRSNRRRRLLFQGAHNRERESGKSAFARSVPNDFLTPGGLNSMTWAKRCTSASAVFAWALLDGCLKRQVSGDHGEKITISGGHRNGHLLKLFLTLHSLGWRGMFARHPRPPRSRSNSVPLRRSGREAGYSCRGPGWGESDPDDADEAA
jgi:hypothetical protein